MSYDPWTSGPTLAQQQQRMVQDITESHRLLHLDLPAGSTCEMCDPGHLADQFLKGRVAAYRRSSFARSLLEYLGMTPEEYGDWFTTGQVAARVRRTWGLA